MRSEKENNGIIKKKTLVQIGAFVLVVLAIVVVLVIKPFERERAQVEDLRRITESERGADTLSSGFGDFLDRERNISKFRSQPSLAQTDKVGYTAFTASEIEAEFQKVSYYAVFKENWHLQEVAQLEGNFDYFYSLLFD